MLNNANKTTCDIHGVYGVYGVYGRPYPPITPITPIKPLNKGVAFMAFMDVGREGRPQKSHRTNRPASLAFDADKRGLVNCLGDSRPYGGNSVVLVIFCHVGEHEQNTTR